MKYWCLESLHLARLKKEIAAKIESNFFSMDIAKTKNGDWTIIELGDGQVAGLPDKVNRNDFYGIIQKFYGR